jgi:hypothetical protein
MESESMDTGTVVDVHEPTTEPTPEPPPAPAPTVEVTVQGGVLNMERLAEIGAKVRLTELAQETALILRTFPNLNGGHAVNPVKELHTLKRQLRTRTPHVQKRTERAWSPEQREKFASTMAERSGRTEKTRSYTKSPAERKAISQRMKSYWRKRRAASA